MGRSVETVGDHVVYFDCSEYYENTIAEELWNDLIANFQDSLIAKYKSLETVKGKWIERENRIILENGHVQISISEYCGCGAVSVFVNPANEEHWPYSITLAEYWLDQCWSGIMKIVEQYVTALSKLGAMSNGVSVFEKKSS